MARAGGGRGDGDDGRGRPRRPGATAGESLAGRLAHGINRLTWRTPIHKLRLRGRYPLQLLDVPADPVPGSPARGRALIEGRLSYGGEAAPLAALDKPLSPGLTAYYHSFAWLRDLAAAVERRKAVPIADAITRAWLKAHAHPISQPAWRPDLCGRRTLFWAAYAPYLLDTRDAAYRKEVLNALARGARHLDRTADTAPQGLARIDAWAGVIAAGLLFPGGDLRLAHGEAGMARTLRLAVHGDGGLVSRSPSEQLALVELLAQLRAAYEVRARPPSGAIARVLAQAVAVLAGARLGDGALSSWQGGGPLPARRVGAAIAAAGVRPTTRDDARDWGYQRLCSGELALIVDAAPPPAAALSRSACASTLAFELSDGDQRLIVNCGGAPALPMELAAGLRTTAAHSTLILAETNSTPLHGDGSIGRGVDSVELSRGDGSEAYRIEVAHNGYVRRFGLIHRRRLALAADGRSLDGEDRLVPAGKRRRGIHAAALRFHLAPGLEPVLTADGQGALLRPAEGRSWQFRTRAGTLTLEDSLWVDAAGRPRPTRQLVVAFDTNEAGATIPWSLRRAG
jgi:uncharacterized heparinase superfamily protein